MTRPSEHNHEWVVCNPVQPDVEEAPTGYRLQALPIAIDDFGDIQTPPPTITLPTALAGQRDTPTTLDVSVNNGTHTFRNRVTISNRMTEAVRWRTTVTLNAGSVEVFDLDWLVMGSESGSGAGMSMIERMFERWDDADTTLHHNPTLGGAGHTGHEADPDVFYRVFSPPNLYYSASGSEFLACTDGVMDFGGDPENNSESNHGGDGELNPLLWHQHRFSPHLEMNYEGDANIHRVTQWYRAPTEWNNDGLSDPVLLYLGASNPCVANTFNEAYIVNLATGASTAVADFYPPDADPFHHNWDLSKNRYVLDGSTLLASPGPVPEGYVAILLRRTSDDACVAFAAKLEDTDDEPNLFTATEIRRPNYVNLQQFWVNGDETPVDPELNHTTAVNFFSKSTTKRPAGWICARYFVLTGRVTDVQSGLVRLWNSGWLDEEPEEPIEAITAGTAFPNQDAAGVELSPLAEVPALIGCGQSQMNVGPSQFWNMELDPDIGKAPASNPLAPGNPISTLDPLKVIWNDSAGRFEALDIWGNASGGSWGDSVPNSFGSLMTLSHAFKARHGSCWALWLGFNGSGMNATNPLLPASWAPSGLFNPIITASCTVAATGSAAVITAAAGTFLGAVAGAAVRISGSELGWLDFAAGSNEHPLRGEVDADELGGNNTHYGRPVYIVGVALDGSSVTLSGAASAGVTYEFADEGPLSLTFTYGTVPAATLAEATFEAARTHAEDKLRRTLSPKLTLTMQGESDIERTQTQYLTDLQAHIDWLRDDWGIDPNAVEVPHGVVELSPFTPAGTDAQVQAIILAQRAVTDTRDHTFTVDTAPLKLRLESGPWPVTTRSEYGTHWTPQSLNRLGVMIDERYATYSDTPPIDPVDPFPPGSGGDPQDPLDPYPGNSGGGSGGGGGGGGGSVGFIVEDGTGLEDAESYCDVDFATAYFQDYGASAEHVAASVTTRQMGLRVCTERLDQLYGDRLTSYQLQPGIQALEIPRSFSMARSGNLIEGVPVDVKRAVCELLRRWYINPDDLLPDEAAGSNVQTQSIGIGPLHINKSFAGTQSTAKRFPIVEKYMRLSGLLRSGEFSLA